MHSITIVYCAVILFGISFLVSILESHVVVFYSGISNGEAPAAWVKVHYVDYGNQEQLPLSHLRPLEQQFCQLPCQALECSIANIQPSESLQLLPSLSNRTLSEGAWLVETCSWVLKLLLGKYVTVSVVFCGDHNEVVSDVYLSPAVIFSPESLANLPVPAQIVASMSHYQHSQIPINLASFMVSVGIAQRSAIAEVLPMEPPNIFGNSSSIPSCLTSTPVLPQSSVLEVPAVHGLSTVRGLSTDSSACIAVLSSAAVLPSKTALAAQISSSESHPSSSSSDIGGIEVQANKQEGKPQACIGSDCGSVYFSTESSKSNPASVSESSQSCDQFCIVTDAPASRSPLTANELKPLSVDLGASNDFQLLVSLVVSPSKFFVHPVQQQSATDMTALPELLQKHYADAATCMSLPAKDIAVGVLCCAPFPEDGSWCRAVVTSIRRKHHTSESESTHLECRILYFDYGDTLLINSSALYVLDETFLKFPMQCICCSLADTQPILKGSPSHPSKSRETNQESKSSTSTQLTLSKCTQEGEQPQDSLIPPHADEKNNAHEQNDTDGVIDPPAVSLQWTPEAVTLFKELTEDKSLVAVVSMKGN